MGGLRAYPDDAYLKMYEHRTLWAEFIFFTAFRIIAVCAVAIHSNLLFTQLLFVILMSANTMWVGGLYRKLSGAKKKGVHFDS